MRCIHMSFIVDNIEKLLNIVDVGIINNLIITTVKKHNKNEFLFSQSEFRNFINVYINSDNASNIIDQLI